MPLRITGIRADRLRDYDQKHPEEVAERFEVGDVIVLLPDRFNNGLALFNCTKQSIIENRYWDNGGILCLRAYDVARIILTNDDEPAPVS